MTRDASKRLISATQMSPVTESQLASGSDGIVDHQPSAANTTFAAVRFEHKEYNVTNYFQKFWIIPGIIPLCFVWKSTVSRTVNGKEDVMIQHERAAKF